MTKDRGIMKKVLFMPFTTASRLIKTLQLTPNLGGGPYGPSRKPEKRRKSSKSQLTANEQSQT